jgi:hypothetical protein
LTIGETIEIDGPHISHVIINVNLVQKTFNRLKANAFYEVVFVKLQIRRRVDLPGRWIGFAILEIDKTTTDPASIFCSRSLRFYAGGFLGRWGKVAPEQPSIRAGERHQTPHILYARERW